MPVSTGHTMPKEESLPPIDNDVYNVEITDIEYEVKPSPFKKKDGTPEEDSRQYKVKLTIKEAGAFEGRFLMLWLRESLRASTKAKGPTLPAFLLAVTGETFGPDDHEKITADFMNALIGSQLRVTTELEASKDGSKEYAKVKSCLAVKK